MRRCAVIAALVALLIAAAAGAARAESVVAGLSQARIAITANFDGSEILLFGAIRRDAPPPEGAPIEVIVAVTGPPRPEEVRRKARRFGIWINTQSVGIDHAPRFYAVATTGPLDRILSQTEDLRHKVSVPQAIRAVGAPDDVRDKDAFIEALIRLRTAQGLYILAEGSVSLREATLFNTRIRLPANLAEGDYRVRIFLTRAGRVVDLYETVLPVQKVGLERFLFHLSHDRPLAYGLMALALATLAGWGASAAFRALGR
jgi:uncharacterized protein (TIGR02186 family)